MPSEKVSQVEARFKRMGSEKIRHQGFVDYDNSRTKYQFPESGIFLQQFAFYKSGEPVAKTKTLFRNNLIFVSPIARTFQWKRSTSRNWTIEWIFMEQIDGIETKNRFLTVSVRIRLKTKVGYLKWSCLDSQTGKGEIDARTGRYGWDGQISGGCIDPVTVMLGIVAGEYIRNYWE